MGSRQARSSFAALHPAFDKRFHETHQCMHAGARMAQAAMHLFATAFPEQTPRAKVFTVVGQQAITVLAETGACAAHRFIADVAGARRRADRQGMAGGEVRQFHFFNRAAMR